MQDALNKYLIWPRFYVKIECAEHYEVIIHALIEAGYVWDNFYITHSQGAVFNKVTPLLIVQTPTKTMQRAAAGPMLSQGESCDEAGQHVEIDSLLLFIDMAKKEVAKQAALRFAKFNSLGMLIRPKV